MATLIYRLPHQDASEVCGATVNGLGLMSGGPGNMGGKSGSRDTN